MRAIPLLAAFIHLGIAAAGAIPEVVAPHDIVPDGKDGQGGHTSLGLPTTTTLFHIPRATLPGVAGTKDTGDAHHHTKSSKKGKHSHSMTSRSVKSTDVGSHTPSSPTASASDLHSYTPTGSSDHPKHTGNPSSEVA